MVAAELAAKLGAKTVLIEEKPRLGGECLWNGCVPSKALIHAARAAWNAGHSEKLGIQAKTRIDFGQVMKHVNGSISFIEHHHDNDAFYRQLGIDVLHGPTRFKGLHEIQVGDTVVTAKRIIIATGSSPSVPSIEGIDHFPYLTNETIFSLEEIPAKLAVIGGGPIGCELGQAFAMLGSNVTILQAAPRLLPHDEPEASEQVLQAFKAMGITVKLNVKLQRVSGDKRSLSIEFDDRGNKDVLEADKLLIAVGRKPNIPKGLQEIGIMANERGIVVDQRLRTNYKHIFAVGDCNGGVQFTHIAAQQAVIAAQNALLGLPKTFNDKFIPWATFTTPEVAHFGPTKEQLGDTPYKVASLNFNDIDKAVTENEKGYIEVLTDASDRVIAETVVGANAAEILGQIVFLRESKTPLKNIAEAVQAYPTYSLGLKMLSANVMLDKLKSGVRAPLLQIYIKLRLR